MQILEAVAGKKMIYVIYNSFYYQVLSVQGFDKAVRIQVTHRKILTLKFFDE